MTNSLTKTQLRVIAVSGSLGLLMVVGYVDCATGYDLSLLSFYFLPIVFALKYAGKGFAYLMAVLAALVWMIADLISGRRYPNSIDPIWNTVILLSVFILVVFLFSTRDHLLAEVKQRSEKLRLEALHRNRLEKELLAIAEREQRRIANDLHDSLGQHLTATALASKVLAKKLSNKAVVEPAMANGVVAMLEAAIELTRNLARTLHPVELGANGLENALQNLASNLSQVFSIHCTFQGSGKVILSDSLVAVHLYRIAQEAATNAIRHGRANKIAISLEASGDSLLLAITDNGTGLQSDTASAGGMGLRIMDYRADLIGATFNIGNIPQGGARAVCVYTPGISRNEEYADEN